MTWNEVHHHRLNLFENDLRVCYISLRYLNQHTPDLVSTLSFENTNLLLRRLFYFVQRCENENVQFEATRLLSNWACEGGKGTSAVIRRDVAEMLLNVIKVTHLMKIRKQAIWCLGNIANDEECRKYLQSNGAVDTCFQLLPLFLQSHDDTPTILIWTLANLCYEHEKSDRPFAHFRPAIKAFNQVIDTRSADHETIFEACRGLRNLAQGESVRVVQDMLDAGCARSLIKVISKTRTLGDSDQAILAVSIGLLGNWMLGSDQQMQIILDSDILPTLRDVLGHANAQVAARTCWLLSNVAAGTESQRRMLTHCSGLLNVLLLECYHVSSLVGHEAVIAVCNMFKFGSDDLRVSLVEMGFLEVICERFRASNIDFSLIKVILEALEAILRVGSLKPGQSPAENRYAPLLRHLGVKDRLEELSHQHLNFDSSKSEGRQVLIKCIELWLRYF